MQLDLNLIMKISFATQAGLLLHSLTKMYAAAKKMGIGYLYRRLPMTATADDVG